MICAVRDCTECGVWKPVVVLRAPMDYKLPPVNGTIEMFFCDEHKNIVGLWDIISDEDWEQLCRKFKNAGFIEPEKALTKLFFIRVRDEDEHKI